MQTLAIFIDKGFITKQITQLNTMDIDFNALNDILVNHIKKRFPLHKLYTTTFWYDGKASNKSERYAHECLRKNKNIKLYKGWRLYSKDIPHGFQKAVDGKLMCDLLKLSYTKAITDAVLVTGDLDMHPAIVDAQKNKVKVHLSYVEQHPLPNNITPELLSVVDSTIVFKPSQFRKAFFKKKIAKTLVKNTEPVIKSENYSNSERFDKIYKRSFKKISFNKKKFKKKHAVYDVGFHEQKNQAQKAPKYKKKPQSFSSFADIAKVVYENLSDHEREMYYLETTTQEIANKSIDLFAQTFGILSSKLNNKNIKDIKRHLTSIAQADESIQSKYQLM